MEYVWLRDARTNVGRFCCTRDKMCNGIWRLCLSCDAHGFQELRRYMRPRRWTYLPRAYSVCKRKYFNVRFVCAAINIGIQTTDDLALIKSLVKTENSKNRWHKLIRWNAFVSYFIGNVMASAKKKVQQKQTTEWTGYARIVECRMHFAEFRWRIASNRMLSLSLVTIPTRSELYSLWTMDHRYRLSSTRTAML